MVCVGVDAWNLPGDRRGVGRYVRAILREWVAHFGDRVEPVLVIPEWHTWTARRRYLREIGNPPLRVVSRALHRRARIDVLWFPFNGCSWTAFSLPAVATLHDATVFVLPEAMGEIQPIMRTAAQRCPLLLTDSRFSQAELARELSIAPERLVPVHLGVEAPPRAAPERRLAEFGRYVLFVGTSDRRKGIDVLVDAMRIVAQRQPDVTLVLAGAASDALPDLDGVPARVMGFVDDDDLDALYAGAAVFAFPSRYEGFGLPPLEAMRLGTPVVAADATAIPEVLGDAALLVTPGDAHALAAGILRVMDDGGLQTTLRERGLRRARELSWRATAAATLAVLERAQR